MSFQTWLIRISLLASSTAGAFCLTKCKLQYFLGRVCAHTHTHTHTNINIRFSDSHAACVILASGGYPSVYKTGFLISGLAADGSAGNDNVTIYHSGTEKKEDSFFTAGGRVLGLTAIGSTLEAALLKAYEAAEKINFEGIHYRKDIGKY